MFFAKFGWNWTSVSGEDENVKSLQADRWTEDRQSEKLTLMTLNVHMLNWCHTTFTYNIYWPIKINFSVNMHMYTVCHFNYNVTWKSVERFQMCCTDKLFQYRCMKYLISKFKRGIMPPPPKIIKISCKYAHLHSMSFIKFYKVSWYSVEGFQMSCIDKLFQ